MEKAATQRKLNVNAVIATFAIAIAKQTMPARITIPLLILDNCFLSMRGMENKEWNRGKVRPTATQQ